MTQARLYLAIVVTLALPFLPAAGRAQDAESADVGALRGTVTASGSGAPIDGVVVAAEADGRERYGRSDANGEFAIELVPGTYDVTFSHPQFDSRTFPDVHISPGQTSQADITLTRGATGPSGRVEEIVVTGRYVERTVDQERFSDSVLDVLSKDDFAITADSDVVGALSRVTGITIVDDKFVYIRGLGERYSSTLFNGSLLPSPDPARRVVPLDLFPSGVMEQLTIQKTWAPYLPADFSGGSLQMTTREIPGEATSRLSVSAEYNTETTGRTVTWNDGDDLDWTGFEGGFRDFPGLINDLSVDGRLPSPNSLADDELRAVGVAVDRTFDTTNIVIPPNATLDFSHGNSHEAPVGTLGYLVGLRYENDWSFTRENRRTSTTVFDPDSGGFVPAVANDFVEDETVNTISYSGLATGEWGVTDTQFLRATLFYAHLTDKRVIESDGFLFENSRNVETTTWEWEERQLWSAQLVGDHFFPDFASLAVDWGATYSQATRDKPDTRYWEYEDLDEDGVFTFSRDAAGNSRQWEDLTDDALDLYLNGEIPIPFHDNLITTLKIGTKWFDKTRESDLRKFRFNPRFSAAEFDAIDNGPPEDVFADDNIGRDKWEFSETTQFSDSYDADEEILAFYAQVDNQIFEDWRLLVGLRYEDSLQRTETRNPTGGAPITTELDDDFLLPAAALTWAFLDDHQLRAAYSQTINRPDIREISPAAYLDPEDRDVFVGNPDLAIAEIDNYDLRWEWYYGGLDNLQLAAFYKDFTSPIEETLLLQGSTVLRTYRNAEGAELYGVEFSVRQGLEFLGDWSRDIYFKFNGAWIDSEVEVAPGPQTNKKRQLQGQSDWVVNTQLTYDDLLRDIQATVAFNMFGERISDVGVNGFDDAYEQPAPQLDLIYQQGFRALGRDFRAVFSAENLIDPDIERTRSSITERSYNSGRSFEIKVEMAF